MANSVPNTPQKLSSELGFTVARNRGRALHGDRSDRAGDAAAQRQCRGRVRSDVNLLAGCGFLKAANEVGLKAPFYANSGLAQKSFIESAGPLGEGVHVLSIGNLPYDPTPAEQKLAALLKKNGAEPQGWGEIVGGNGLMTVVAAVKAIDGRSPATRCAIPLKACAVIESIRRASRASPRTTMTAGRTICSSSRSSATESSRTDA